MSKKTKAKPAVKKPAAPKPAAPSVVPALQIDTKELTTAVAQLPAIRVIKTEPQYQTAMEEFRAVGLIAKNIKAKKDSVLNPLKLATKNLNAIFKPFEDKIAMVEEGFKKVLNAYAQQKFNEREEALEKIENDKRLSNPATIQAKVNEVVERPSDTYKIKVVFVEDIKKVPAEYLEVNHQKILEAYKNGVMVAGTKVVEEVRVRR